MSPSSCFAMTARSPGCDRCRAVIDRRAGTTSRGLLIATTYTSTDASTYRKKPSASSTTRSVTSWPPRRHRPHRRQRHGGRPPAPPPPATAATAGDPAATGEAARPACGHRMRRDDAARRRGEVRHRRGEVAELPARGAGVPVDRLSDPRVAGGQCLEHLGPVLGDTEDDRKRQVTREELLALLELELLGFRGLEVLPEAVDAREHRAAFRGSRRHRVAHRPDDEAAEDQGETHDAEVRPLRQKDREDR